MNNWKITEINPKEIANVQSFFGNKFEDLENSKDFKNILSSIFLRRNIKEGQDILYFLESDLRFLHSPYNFSSIEDAVERILQAKDEEEKVLIFGDSDVDGITSTAILYLYLKSINIDVSNYYAAFILLSCIMLKKNGEIVAITPRSFCNGTYFYNFRKDLLSNMYFKDIHILDCRKAVFNIPIIINSATCLDTKITKEYYSKIVIKQVDSLDGEWLLQFIKNDFAILLLAAMTISSKSLREVKACF